MDLFAELGMAEHHAVRANGDLRVADRRLAEALAVQPHFGPGQRVERERTFRPFELDRGGLARDYLYGARHTIAEHLVGDLQVMLSLGDHDLLAPAAAQETLVLVDLHVDRRTHRDPSGHW